MADDVFIFRSSGLVLFSRCYGGEYCAVHPDHNLQAGFLAALYLFSQEYSEGNELQAVLFKRIRMDFAVDAAHDVIVVFTNPSDSDPAEICSQLNQTLNQFVQKYTNNLGDEVIVKEVFEDFEADLHQSKIVCRECQGEIPLILTKEYLADYSLY
ncbi:MAG TPA: hypothetical protein VKK79_12565 [Candidatus Lokiarchaeia archaeon]|nr:hypothetical protein [Candidatus Lokiarchaeia archaeon]